VRTSLLYTISGRHGRRTRHGRRAGRAQAHDIAEGSRVATQQANDPTDGPGIAAQATDATQGSGIAAQAHNATEGPNIAAYRAETARERPDIAAQRVREAGGPTDRASYACACGYLFAAAVSTTVECPHCGASQAW
jgi:rubrerythrin